VRKLHFNSSQEVHPSIFKVTDETTNLNESVFSTVRRSIDSIRTKDPFETETKFHLPKSPEPHKCHNKSLKLNQKILNFSGVGTIEETQRPVTNNAVKRKYVQSMSPPPRPSTMGKKLGVYRYSSAKSLIFDGKDNE